VILFVLIVYRRDWESVKTRDWGWIILRGAGGMFAFIGVWVAFLHLDFGTNYFVSYASATLGGYILGRFLCGEKITKSKAISLVIAILGLSLIYSANIEFEKIFYIGLTFFAGIGTAIWTVVSKKISSNYSNLQIVFLDTFVDLIIVFSFSLIFKESWSLPLVTPSWMAIYLLTFVQIATNVFVVYGFKRVEANLGSLILLFDIVAGLLLAALLYKELPNQLTLIGGLLIVIAISLPSLNAILVKEQGAQKN
jgi:drug/metabolite transporter (DMT)-like permease